MGIEAEDIRKVRDATDIVAVISPHVALRKVGRRFQGLCPFHNEKTPSFSVNAEDGFYHCFGCKASGDAITFLREIEGLDFVGAVQQLATKTGVSLRFTSEGESESYKRRSRLVDAAEKAVEFYHQKLLSSSEAGEARGYLRTRGYDGDVVRRYRLGWAGAGWDELSRHVRLNNDDLAAAGLGRAGQRGQTDFFRNRLLFPIFDERGDAVGFGGRILPGHEGPKYKNTSGESTIYDKSRVLYGLHSAKADIVRAGEVIICEGYTDVIGFDLAGVPRAVATCGTALTESHVRLLKKFASRLVLAFDADGAGQAAADRVYEWEQKFEVDVFVAALPDGVDPGDLAGRDPEALRQAVVDARPFLQFRVERVLANASLATAEARARAAGHALEVVREHPNELVRDQYVMTIADRCRIDVEKLREWLADGRRVVVPRAETRVERERDSREDQALRLLIHDPEAIAGKLVPVLFADRRRRGAYEALIDHGSPRAAVDMVEDDLADLIRRLSVEETSAEADDIVALLAAAAAERVIGDLLSEQRGSSDPSSYAASIAWLKQQTQALREHETRAGAVAQLVPWLSTHGMERVDV